MTTAETWAMAMRRARTLQPEDRPVTKSPDLRLAKAVHRAIGLPTPAAIARTILASTTGAHNGLRAATYEARVRGTGVDSDTDDDRVRLTTTERLAAARMTATTDNRTEINNLRDLSKASERFCVAIGGLVVLVADGDPGDMDEFTWDEALKCGHLICELRHTDVDGQPLKRSQPGDVLRSRLETDDGTIGNHIDRAVAAVVTIAKIRDHYRPHAPTRWQQIKESGIRADEICDVCARCTPPVYVVVRNKKRLACRHCNDLWLEHGERPTVEVKQAYHHASQLDYRRALSRWIEQCAEERRAHHA